MTEIEKYSVSELNAFNQGLDKAIEIIEQHKKAYDKRCENDSRIIALSWVIKDIKNEYV